MTDKELEKEASILQDHIVDYLKTRGWKLMVVDGFRIEQRDPSKKMKFEFVMGFVGQDTKKIEELKKLKK